MPETAKPSTGPHSAGSGRVLIFRSDGCLLVTADADPRLDSSIFHVGFSAGESVSVPVGALRGAPCLAHWGADDAPEGYEYRNLRELIGVLKPDVASLATRARQLLEWDRNHCYCGRCGAATEEKDSERAKVCPACGHTAYPRINPAVIVAVVREGKLLLARNRRFRNNMHSIIAGFVEAGETLEDTVHREIGEEVNIRVGDLRYVKSQAWPFPHTLMVGFVARYIDGELRADGDEIVAAGWFDRQDLPPLPGHGSLSRELIERVLGPIEQ